MKIEKSVFRGTIVKMKMGMASSASLSNRLTARAVRFLFLGATAAQILLPGKSESERHDFAQTSKFFFAHAVRFRREDRVGTVSATRSAGNQVGADPVAIFFATAPTSFAAAVFRFTSAPDAVDTPDQQEDSPALAWPLPTLITRRLVQKQIYLFSY